MVRTVMAGLALSVLVACAGGTAKPPVDARLARRPTLTITNVAGLSDDEVRTMFAPTLDSLHRCAPGSGGKINLRVERKEGRLHLVIEPGASLDPRVRECVLDALSAIDLEQTGGNVSSARPPGFTALMSVAW